MGIIAEEEYEKRIKDKIKIRFGYCDNTGKLIVRPLNLSESELTELGKEAAKDPEIKKMLKGL